MPSISSTSLFFSGDATRPSRRFSRTESPCTMRRSSGTYANPSAKRTCAGWLNSSLPLKIADPRVLSKRPMMDFNVVVLPAPLRPIRQTISPLATSILTSCSTWLAPYQALRLLICNIRSVLPLAKIDPLHRLVLADLQRRSFRQQLAMVQHEDAVADPEHQLHLVLDQNNCAFARQLHDEIHHDAGFFRAHPGGRLIKQQQPRPARQRHSNFERALLTVRECLRRSSARLPQSDQRQQFIGLFGQLGEPGARPPHIVTRHQRLQPDADVLARRQLGKDIGDLKRFCDSHMRKTMLRNSGHIPALEFHAAARWRQGPGQQVEIGALSGAVGADERGDGHHGLPREINVPQIPAGKNSTQIIKTAPTMSCQCTVQTETRFSSSRNAAAPIIGPKNVPIPPRSAIITTTPEVS